MQQHLSPGLFSCRFYTNCIFFFNDTSARPLVAQDRKLHRSGQPFPQSQLLLVGGARLIIVGRHHKQVLDLLPAGEGNGIPQFLLLHQCKSGSKNKAQPER